MQVRVDRQSKVPLYRQVADQLRALIVGGVLPGGHRLPSERDLARELGVNRTTVVNAYGSLAADGLVEGRVGVGTVVRGRTEPEPERPAAPMPWSEAIRYR
ncbi:MAG: winged helix-turn-helix transcriptional regulator, partial [Anaerolineae bacterium]|nr:winged helix-turn-helix transcriptional regulator [Anaerolineae bacterium]